MNSNRLLADERWIGKHGIGRFAGELLDRVGHAALTLGGRPSDPWDPLRLSKALRRSPRDSIFLSAGYNAPYRSPRRFVFTIHDLGHIDCEQYANWLTRTYYGLFVQSGCRHAAAIFTVSAFSRNRILEWAGIDAAKVINVGNGVNSIFDRSGPAHVGRRPYLLCVSNRRPHKNESRLIQAYRASRAHIDLDLILTGSANSEVATQIEHAGLSKQVSFTGKISDESMAALYRGATAMVFPSLYEGFGLPIVEAMASGTPVLSSTTTSMPEVAGNAAMLVNPLDVAAIAAGIDALCDSTATRDLLRAKGAVQAKLFSWEAVGQRARDAIDRIAS